MKKIITNLDEATFQKSLRQALKDNRIEAELVMRFKFASILPYIKENLNDIQALILHNEGDIKQVDIENLLDIINFAEVPIIFFYLLPRSAKNKKDMEEVYQLGLKDAIFVGSKNTKLENEICALLKSPRTNEQAKLYYGLEPGKEPDYAKKQLDLTNEHHAKLIFEYLADEAAGTLEERYEDTIALLPQKHRGTFTELLPAPIAENLKGNSTYEQNIHAGQKKGMFGKQKNIEIPEFFKSKDYTEYIEKLSEKSHVFLIPAKKPVGDKDYSFIKTTGYEVPEDAFTEIKETSLDEKIKSSLANSEKEESNTQTEEVVYSEDNPPENPHKSRFDRPDLKQSIAVENAIFSQALETVQKAEQTIQRAGQTINKITEQPGDLVSERPIIKKEASPETTSSNTEININIIGKVSENDTEIHKGRIKKIGPQKKAPKEHEHIFGEEETEYKGCGKRTLIIKRCTICSQIDIVRYGDAQPHQFEFDKELKATCDVDGAIIKKCKVCGTTDKITIPKTGHDYSEAQKTYNGCGNPYLLVSVCSKCGSRREEECDEIAEHIYNITSREEADCTKDGLVISECALCHNVLKETLPQVPHAFTDIVSTYIACGSPKKLTHICKDCGYTEELDNSSEPVIEHEYSISEKDNCKPTCAKEGKEIKICSLCGDTIETVIPKLEHNFADIVATYIACGSPKKLTHTCKDCGYTEELDNSSEPIEEHKYEISYDTYLATCTKEGKEIYVCELCGDIKEVILPKQEHSFTDIVKSYIGCGKKSQLTHTCSICNLTEELDNSNEEIIEHNYVIDSNKSHEASCSNEGIITKVCSLCGDITSEILPQEEHEFGDIISEYITCGKPKKLTHICKVCGYTEELNNQEEPIVEHNFVTSEELSVNATCTKAGKVVKVCTLCGEKTEDIIPKELHKFADIVKAYAGCGKPGKLTHICKECGYTEELDNSAETIIDHNYEVDDSKGLKPTCTKEGIEVKVCSLCGDVVEKTIPKTEHNFADIVKAYVGCNKPNILTHTCKECGYTEETDNSNEPLTEHDFVLDNSRHKEPTCTEEGFDTYVCTLCKEEKTESIPAIPHDFSPTISAYDGCEKPKKLTHSCKICGLTEELDNSEGEIVKHDYKVDVVNSHKATCTSEGLITHICSLCGDVQKEVTPIQPHEFADIVKTYAGCGKRNKITRTCSLCKMVEELDNSSEDITQHNYEINKEESITATCTNDGRTVRVCSLCGDTNEEILPRKPHRFTDIVSEYISCGKPKKETRKCTECGFTEELDTKDKPVVEHIYENSQNESKEPTCISEGRRVSICSLCGDRKVENLPKKAHSFTDIVSEYIGCGKPRRETRKCIQCGYIEEINTFGKPIVEHTYNINKSECSEPTCNKEGRIVKICSLCGDRQIEILPKSNHNYGDITRKYIGCGKPMLLSHKCIECNYIEELDNSAETPVEHDYQPVENESKSETCTKEGLRVSACSRCGKKNKEILPKHPHNFGSIISEYVSCGKPKKLSHKCQECGLVEVLDNSKEPVEEHEYKDDKIKIITPTCTSTGKETKTCIKCNKETTSILPVLPHSYGKSTREYIACGKPYRITHVCITCGKTEDITDKNDIAEHSYIVSAKDSKEATCTSKGIEVKICNHCGDAVTTEIPKKSHNFGKTKKEYVACGEPYTYYKVCNDCETRSDVDVKDREIAEHTLDGKRFIRLKPDCKTEGIESETCKLCQSTVDVRNLQKTEHDYKDTERTEPTCKENGIVTRTCSICGEKKTKTLRKVNHKYEKQDGKQKCVYCGKEKFNPIPLFILIGVLALIAAITIIAISIGNSKPSIDETHASENHSDTTQNSEKFIESEDVSTEETLEETTMESLEEPTTEEEATAPVEEDTSADLTTEENTSQDESSTEKETTSPATSTVVITTVAPTTVEPTTIAPTTVAPTTVAPTTEAPTTVAPTTVAPTTVEPTTIAPTTIAPTTVAPTTEAPTTVAPTTEPPKPTIDPKKDYSYLIGDIYNGEDVIKLINEGAPIEIITTKAQKYAYNTTVSGVITITDTSIIDKSANFTCNVSGKVGNQLVILNQM